MDGFKLTGLAQDVPVVEDLSNTERAMLREMAQPGNPLWKVLRSMLDYGEALKDALVMADFSDEAEMKQARKIQATIAACTWVQQTFAAALTDTDGPAQIEEIADV